MNDYESKMKEKMDEIFNLLKLKEYLMTNKYLGFHIKIADNSYYNWTLGERRNFL